MDSGIFGAEGASEDVSILNVVAGKVFIPDAAAMFSGTYVKEGQDLIITGPDGAELRVADYFTYAFPPELVAPNGAVIRGEHAQRLSGAIEDTRLAQAQGADGQSSGDAERSLENAIGQVEAFEGSVTVTRADGTTVVLGDGDLVFQNDVVATGPNSTVSLTFVDGTIFSLSAGSRMILDELIYDPDGTDNSAVFSLIEGGFVFITGAVAPSGGMDVQTPTGVLGIRGTTVEVQILTQNGVSEVLVSLLLDPDGGSGEVEVFDFNGDLIAIITSTDTSWIISPIEGETREIPRTAADDISDPVLLAQAIAAFRAANARVDGGDTYVSQERVNGGGGDTEIDTPDDQSPGEEGQQQDTQDGPGGDDAAPEQEPAPTDEEAPPGEQGEVPPEEIEEGNLQEDPETEIAALPDAEDIEGVAVVQSTPVDPAAEAPVLDQSTTPEAEGAVAQVDPTAPVGEASADSNVNDASAQTAVQGTGEGATGGTGLGGADIAATFAAPATLSPSNEPATASTNEIGNTGVLETGQLDPEKVDDVNPLTGLQAPELSGSGTMETGQLDPEKLTVTQESGGVATVALNDQGAIQLGQVAQPSFSGSTPTSDPLSTTQQDQPFSGQTQTSPTFAFSTDDGLGDNLSGGTSFDGFTTDQSEPFLGSDPELGDDSSLSSIPSVSSSLQQPTTTIAPPATTSDPAPSLAAETGLPEPDSTPQNQPPVAQSDAVVLFADQAGKGGTLQATDPEGGAVTFAIAEQPQNGTISLDPVTGDFLFTANPGFLGSDSFTYTVTDSDGAVSPPASVDIQYNATNLAPDAQDDPVTTAEDTSVTFNVLGNDSDPEGAALSIDGVTAAGNGNVGVNADGTLTYTPDPDFVGSDSFDYTVSDGAGGTASATVFIAVTSVNDAPLAGDDLATTAEDTSILINVLDNDSDPENAALSIQSLGPVSNGSAAIEGSAVRFTPDADFNGTTSFTYTIADGAGGTATATVNVTVSAQNDAPIAEDDAASTTEDTPVTFNVLANDSDVDGPALSVGSVTQPTNGQVVFSPDGQVTYTPDADFTGDDSFSYFVTDGTASASGTVTISVAAVNDPPVAEDDTATTAEDTSVLIDVLSNDSDPEGAALSVQSLGAAGNGSVAIEGTSIRYTPDPDFNGSDSFTYVLSDGAGGTSEARVDVEVTPVDDAPVAGDDVGLSTGYETPLTLAAADLLSNDDDGDPETVQTLSILSVENPTGGTVELVNDQITFTPDDGFTGAAGFEYTVSDGTNVSTASVTLSVGANAVPVALDTDLTVSEDQAVSFDITALTSDADGDVLIPSFATPANGAVTQGTAPGIWVYTPDEDFNGSDTFDYTVSDGNGGVATATITVTVNAVNDAPVARDDGGFTTGFGVPLSIDPADLLANDDDGDPEQTQSLFVSATGNAVGGTVAIVDDGSGSRIVFTPEAGFSGDASFDYSVSDGSSTSAVAGRVTLTVADNLTPVAVDDTGTTAEDTSVLLDVLGNDSDPEGGALSIQSLGVASNGTVAVEGNSVRYTPGADFVGADSFTYVVSDGQGGEATARVDVTITAVNDAPEANNDGSTTAEDASILIDVLANDNDPENDALSIQSVGDPSNGSVAIEGGAIRYTPDADFNGSDSFTYEISDGAGGTSSATVGVTITSINDAPVAEDDTVTTPEDTPITLDVQANDSDIEPGTLSISSFTQGANGTVSLDGAGRLVYTPNADFTGIDTFEYTLEDADGGSDTAVVTVDVGAVNDPPVAVDDVDGTAEDTSVLIDVLANDSDPDGPAPSLQSVGVAGNGTVVIEGTGVRYTPDADFNGADSFTYTISDGQGGTATARVDVTVEPVNDAPDARNDDFTTTENAIVQGDIFADNGNGADADPEGSALTLISASDGGVNFRIDGAQFFLPSRGVLQINPDGTFVFNPAGLSASVTDFEALGDGETLTQTFSYVVEDDLGLQSTGTVSILVQGENDAPITAFDRFTIAENDVISGNLLTDITTGAGADSDPEGDFFEITAFGGVALADADEDVGLDGTQITVNGRGQLTLFADGEFTFDTAGAYDYLNDVPTLPFQINERLEYTVTDSNGASSVGVSDIFIQGSNDAPAATDDGGFSTPFETAITIAAADLLANDSDAEGGVLSITDVGGAVGGSVALNGTDITFTPTVDFSGAASFTYTVSDGTDTSTASVTLSVGANQVPVAQDDTLNATEEFTGQLVGNVITGAGQDTDPDGDPITVVSASIGGVALTIGQSFELASGGFVTVAANGDVTFNADGQYEALGQTATVTDTVEFDIGYTISDGNGGTDSATANFVISGVNDAPQINPDTVEATRDQPLVIDVADLFANDIDPEAQALTLFDVAQAVNGQIQDNQDGTVTFTPDAGFTGVASFVYQAIDAGASVVGAVVTVNVVAPINQPPQAGDDTGLTTAFETVLQIDPATLLNNDTDPDGDGLTITDVTAPSGGTVAIVGGLIEFTPDVGYSGSAGFSYTVSDGQGGTDAATVSITVAEELNTPPFAVDDSFATNEDTTFTTANVFENDNDDDDDVLSVSSIDTTGTTGVVTDNGNGTFDYDPNGQFESLGAGETATDSFTYTASDGRGGFDTATVTININGVNDVPTVPAVQVGLLANGTIAGTVLGASSDPDGDALTVTAVAGQVSNVGAAVAYSNGNDADGIDGLITINADGSFFFDTNGAFDALASGDSITFPAIAFTVSDGNGGVVDGSVQFQIDGVNDAPVAADDSFTTTENGVLIGDFFADNGSGADFDPESGTLTLVSATDSDGGNIRIDGANIILASGATLRVNPTGTFSFDPGGFVTTTTDYEALGDGQSLTETFTYLIEDAEGAQATGTVSILVQGENDAPDTALDQYNLTEDETVSGNALTDATTGLADFDPEGDAFEITAINGVALAAVDEDAGAAGIQVTVDLGGQLTIFADGAFSFDTAGAYDDLGDGAGQLSARLQSVQYTVTDSNGASATETLRFFVQGVNDAPVATLDTASTDEDVPVTIDVLGNDSDPDGPALSVTGVTQGTNGGVVIEADGRVTYTPNSGYSGADSFTYTLSDGAGGTAIGTVNVAVALINADPGAADDAYSVNEDNILTVSAALGLLANDTDADGDPLIAAALTDVVNGTLNLNSDGSFTYTPDADFNGTDSFTYTADDGHGGTATGTVTLTVVPVADPVFLDAVTGDDFLDVGEQAAPIVITGVGEVNGSMRVTFGTTEQTVATGPDGTFSATFDPSALPDVASVNVQIEATDANGNVGGVASRTVAVGTSSNSVSISVAGPVTNDTGFGDPAALDISFMPYEALFEETAPGSGTFVERAPSSVLPGEVRFISDSGRTFAFIGENMDFGAGTGLVTGFQIGTPTDPDYYSATGLATSVAEINALIADSLVSGSIVETPFDSFFGSLNQTFTGSDGDDFLYYSRISTGNDRFEGNGGDDEFAGGRGDDTYIGGAGDDFFLDGRGSNVFDGGSDPFDAVSFEDAEAGVTLDLNNTTNGVSIATKTDGTQDSLSGIELIVGTNLADDITLTNNSSFGLVAGLAGADTLRGGVGGLDYLSYQFDSRYTLNTTGVTVMLATGIAFDLFGDQDDVGEFEGVYATEFGDSLTASDTGSQLYGFGGNDTLVSGAGDDLLVAGDGADSVVYTGGEDTVQLFTGAEDALDFTGPTILSLITSLQLSETANVFGGTDVLFDFTGGNVLRIENLTFAEAEQELEDAGFGGQDIIVGPTDAEISGTALDDTFTVTAGPLDPAATLPYRIFTASGGNDIYDLTANDPSVYNEIKYDDLGLTGITASIDYTANENTIQKAGGGTDTVIGIANTANFGFGIYGTSGIDTFNVTHDPNAFSFTLIDGSGGNDVVNLAADGSNDIIRVHIGRGNDVVADLGARMFTAGSGEALTFNVTGDDSQTRYFIQTYDGNDSVLGSENDDSFILGAGQDTANGLGGLDRVRYDRIELEQGVDVNLDTGVATGEWGAGQAFNHALSNIEVVAGSDFNDTLRAGSADARLFGNAGDDQLFGSDGRDRLFGGDGDDLIDATGGGVDTLGWGDYTRPGLGTDTIIGHVGTWDQGDSTDLSYGDIDDPDGVTITVGAVGSGTVTGNGINDNFSRIRYFEGSQGDDVFFGSDGDSYEDIAPLGGADSIVAGTNYLTVNYEYETDYFGDSGTPIDVDLAAQTIIDTQSNVDTVVGVDQVRGSQFGDTMTAQGVTRDIEFRGNAGNDTLVDGLGNDRLLGGEGDDEIYSGEGRDRLFGEEGDDLLDASAGSPATQGNGNADFVNPGLGQDTVIGNAALWATNEGIDLGYSNLGLAEGLVFNIDAQGSGTVQSVGAESGLVNDTFTFANFFEGSSGADVFNGGGFSFFQGFVGFGGADQFIGGSGTNDEVSYAFVDEFYDPAPGITGINADFGAGTIIDLQGFTDTITNIERVRGSQFNDTIDASGMGFDVRIRGEAGDDLILDGAGNDSFDLDGGNDTLRYSGGFDYVDDFDVAEDTLELSSEVEAILGSLQLGEFLNLTGVSFGFQRADDSRLDISFGGGFSFEDAYQVIGTFNFDPNGIVVNTNTAGRRILGSPGDDDITVINSFGEDKEVRASAGDDLIQFQTVSNQEYTALNYSGLGTIGLDATLNFGAGQVSTVIKGTDFTTPIGTDTITNLSFAGDAGFGFNSTRADDTITIIGDNTDGRGFHAFNNPGGADTLIITPVRDTIQIEIGDNGDVFADLAANSIFETNLSPDNLRAPASFDLQFTSDPAAAELRLDIRTRDGNDTVFGTDYENRFTLQAGDDFADGRGGMDTIRYRSSSFTSGVVVDLRPLDPNDDSITVTVTGTYRGEAFSHELVNIEGVDGTRFDDVIYGSDQSGDFRGRDGNDFILTGAQSDYVELGSGFDTLAYEGGVAGSEDFIEDFNVNEDTLELQGLALAQVNTLTVTDQSFDGNLRTNLTFEDQSGNEFWLRFKDITLEEGLVLANSLAGSGDNISVDGSQSVYTGTVGDDTFNWSSGALSAFTEVFASTGNDAYQLTDLDPNNYVLLVLTYEELGGSGIALDFVAGREQNFVTKGAAGVLGTDTLTDIHSNVQFDIIGTDGDDDFNITFDPNEFFFANVQFREGQDTISATGGNGVLKLSPGYGDVGALVNLPANEITNVNGDRIELNLTGDLSQTVLQIRTSRGDDTIIGSDRGDEFAPDSGVDIIEGGAGIDRMVYSIGSLVGPGLVVNFADGFATGTWSGRDFTHIISNVEEASGSQFGDDMTAADSGSLLDGRAGDDTLIGGLGNDGLDGGDNNDWLSGGGGENFYTLGAGNDTVVYTGGSDVVGDFIVGEDTFRLDGIALKNYEFINYFDATPEGQVAADINFNTPSDGFFGIRLNGLTVSEAQQLIADQNIAPGTVFVSPGEVVSGTAGNDILVKLGDGEFSDTEFRASDGNDIYNLAAETFTNFNSFEYGTLGATAITADIQMDRFSNTVTKGGLGVDTLEGLAAGAEWGFRIGDTAGDDTFNITQSDNDFSYVQIGLEQGGADTINLSRVGGTTTSVLSISPTFDNVDVVADLSDLLVNQTATIEVGDQAVPDPNLITLNISGDVSSTRIEIRTRDGNDSLIGSDLNERFFTRGGNDTIDGGGGFDEIRYDSGPVTVRFIEGDVVGVGFVDQISNIERVRGSSAGDSITGDGFDNRFDGRDGDDFLDGAGGADTLIGENGDDTLVFNGIGNGSFLDGGADRDALLFQGSGSFDFRGVDMNAFEGLEVLDLENGGADTLTLELSNVFDFSDSADRLLDNFFGATGNNTITIRGEAGDVLQYSAANGASFTEVAQLSDEDGEGLKAYEFTDNSGVLAIVAVDDDVAVQSVA